MEYKEMYLKLFNHVTDAIYLISAEEYDEAEKILKLAQQESEEIFISCKE